MAERFQNFGWIFAFLFLMVRHTILPQTLSVISNRLPSPSFVRCRRCEHVLCSLIFLCCTWDEGCRLIVFQLHPNTAVRQLKEQGAANVASFSKRFPNLSRLFTIFFSKSFSLFVLAGCYYKYFFLYFFALSRSHSLSFFDSKKNFIHRNLPYDILKIIHLDYFFFFN